MVPVAVLCIFIAGFAGLVCGAAIGLSAAEKAAEERFESGEWMRRADIARDRICP